MNRLTRAAKGILLALVCGATASTAAKENPWPKGVRLPPGEAIDEDYRHEFAICDTAGSFRGHVDRYTRGCADDPNAVTALRRLPGGVIAYVSKLAVDLDGSPFACSPSHGRMDQCGTTLMLPDGHGGEVPVDADAVPYVVIPDTELGPPDAAGEFIHRTGLAVGDFGVVIAAGSTIAVIVADTGPYSKLGEGSLALHRLLGRDQCTRRDEKGVCIAVVANMASIGRDVTTILFPGSARRDLTPRTVAAVTKMEGLRLWTTYQQAHLLQPSQRPLH